jgi:peptidoglycan/LPS O-acetylase OafA/YrhL
MNKRSFALYLFALVSLLFSQTAFAYIGPGAGISAIGSAIAFVVVLILLFVGFFWYPIKKFLNRNKAEDASAEKTAEDAKDSDQSRGL